MDYLSRLSLLVDKGKMSHLELEAGYTETREFIDMLDRRVEKVNVFF